MSDGVLAAIIAACATVFGSFLQLKSSFGKEIAGRAPPASGRRKNKLPLALLCAMLGGAALGGFALSQWLTEHERTVQNELQTALRQQIASMSRSESQLEQSRAGTRAEIEASFKRRLGAEGAVVTATVAPCKPQLLVNTPALAPGAGEAPTQPPAQSPAPSTAASSCTEADASPIALCVTLPAEAIVSGMDVFVRPADSDVPWESARVTPGHQVEQARFAEKPAETADGAQSKLVCENFVQWSERARVARVQVRFNLP